MQSPQNTPWSNRRCWLMSEESKRPKIRKTESTGPEVKRQKPKVESTEPVQQKQPTTQIAQPATEKMEVHHHPQLEHKPKPWKEYLLEGMMIFVAVTMGFFAESLREHINENKQANEFAISLYSDLKADTSDLHFYQDRTRIGVHNIDTLMQLLAAHDPKDIPSGKLYWFGLFGGLQGVFAPNNATLLQIKNLGALRYFSSPALRRAIAKYDQELQTYKMTEDQSQGIYTEVRKSRSLLFAFKYNDEANTVVQKYYLDHKSAPVDSFKKTTPPLLSTDKVLFNQYVEMVRSRFLYKQLQRFDTLEVHATRLIGELKKDYNIEDE